MYAFGGHDWETGMRSIFGVRWRGLVLLPIDGQG